MTLEQLRILVKVVQTGSFTRTAELLDSQKSHVSRVVSQLERELGVKLLERTTRSLHVTELGREVYERAVGILSAVDDTVGLVAQSRAEPRGQLRLTCGAEFGLLAVGRWIEAFVAAHPDVTVEAEYTSRVLDVVHEGFDLAIRIGPVPESRLVARPLGQLEYGLFACPRYLARRGEPRHPDALREHGLVMFTGGAIRRGWVMTPPAGSPGGAVTIDGPARIRVNNAQAVRDALLGGLGIGMLPLLVAHAPLAEGRLVPVLPEWSFEPVTVHAVYPSNRFLSPKVRAFVDLAAQAFPTDGALARAALHASCERRSAAPRARPTATATASARKEKPDDPRPRRIRRQ